MADKIVPEDELLIAPGVVIVLAEPGGGKTGLLDSIADRLGVARVRASACRPSSLGNAVVVDAFDEVARVGEARVHDILHTIRDAEPNRVLLSSRSGEWETAKTLLVRDLFGSEPVVAELIPLDHQEQQSLFEHLHPTRRFEEFHRSLSGFELHHLLGNPEFLTLFARAYDEANGRIASRSEVFDLAIENLAREADPAVTAKGAPDRRTRILLADEVFAKLLLSGADGVAVGDIAEGELHPQFATIGLPCDEALSVLGTKLFRPASAPNQHEPVHRIVAEYGAAKYLVKRIEDPSSPIRVRTH